MKVLLWLKVITKNFCLSQRTFALIFIFKVYQWFVCVICLGPSWSFILKNLTDFFIVVFWSLYFLDFFLLDFSLYRLLNLKLLQLIWGIVFVMCYHIICTRYIILTIVPLHFDKTTKWTTILTMTKTHTAFHSSLYRHGVFHSVQNVFFFCEFLTTGISSVHVHWVMFCDEIV